MRGSRHTTIIHSATRIRIWGFLALMVISLAPVKGQVAKGDRRWIRVGSLQSFFNAYGQERAWNGSYYEGMVWPASYRNKDHLVSKRYWVAATDFTDVFGTFWSVRAIGMLGGSDYTRTTAMRMDQVARFSPTIITVDGDVTSAPYAGEVDVVDPAIKPDRIVTNVLHTLLGLTMTRRVYAFSQQYHDNYFVIEYIFKNTGNIDSDDEIELPDQNLTGVMFGGMFHLTTNREAAIALTGENGWGRNQWHTKRGENYADWVAGDATADSIRAEVTWMGLDSRITNPLDHLGAPYLTQNGRLAAADYAGTAFLHVDKSATDHTDDPNQPSTVGWFENDDFPRLGGLDEASYREAYDLLLGTMATDRGDTTRMDAGGAKYPNSLVGAGGAAGVHGYGPYDIAFGDSVRYVEVVAVAGLSRAMTTEVGANWLANSSPFTLPDGSTTTDKTEYKDAWVSTSFDSLMQTFGRARRNFESGFDIPQPPQPPQTFNIDSGGDRISLTWSAAAGVEDAADFGGYRIYRAIGRPDTTYDMIYENGAGTDNPAIVNSYDDVSAVRGFPYYYYVVAYNDGSTNTGSANPGGELHSSRFYTQTTKAAFLRRKAGASLEAIRVVPNPFHIRGRGGAYAGGPDLQYGSGDLRDRIMFLNIPGQCTIRIFTERGDLIKTIHHTNGSGDEPWNSDTDSRQVVVSGVYLAYIEVEADQYDSASGELLYRQGETAVRKIIVVR